MAVNKRFIVAVAAAAALNVSISGESQGAVVINEIYGGGGNAGAQFTNDFVELYNNTATAEAIGGFKVEYASATGTSWAGVTIPANFELPGLSSVLIQFGSSGSVGSPLPSSIVQSGTNLSGSNGKVRLTNGTVTGDATPTATGIIDFVGFGTANAFEGTAAAPAGSNTLAITRTLGVDTNQNGVDFTTAAPSPIPEPTSLAVLGLAALAGLRRRRTA